MNPPFGFRNEDDECVLFHDGSFIETPRDYTVSTTKKNLALALVKALERGEDINDVKSIPFDEARTVSQCPQRHYHLIGSSVQVPCKIIIFLP